MTAPAFLGTLSGTVRISGKDIHQLGIVRHRLDVFGMPAREARDLPVGLGVHPQGDVFREKTFVLQGEMYGDDRVDLMNRLDVAKEFFAQMQGWQGRRGAVLETSEQADRYWSVFFDGQFTWEPIGPDHLATGAKVLVTFTSMEPFAVATELSEVSDPTPAQYRVIDVPLGTAPSDYKLWLQSDGDDDPEVVIGDMIFRADFGNNLGALDIEGNTVEGTYSGTEYTNYTPSELGMQFEVKDKDQTAWTGIVARKDAYSVLMVIRPQYDYDVTYYRTFFCHYYNASNYYGLFYNHANDRFYFRKRDPGGSRQATCIPGAFSAGDRFVLVGTWGSRGTEVYCNGELGVSKNTDQTALSQRPESVNLFWKPNPTAFEVDTEFDLICIWDRELSVDEVWRYSKNPELIERHNSKMAFTLAMANNETITVDSATQKVEHLRADNSIADVRANMVGEIPKLVPPATCVWLPYGRFNDLKLSYRKRWL